MVGDNGAGKSTLIKAIDGVGPPDSGEAYFEGKKVKISTPQIAERLGIATVFQDLALCDNLDVVANLFLGKELVERGPVHVIDEVDMEQRAKRASERPVGDDARQRPDRGRAASPAASVSRWRSPAPCSASPRWCCSTSRPPLSASNRRPRCSAW